MKPLLGLTLVLLMTGCGNTKTDVPLGKKTTVQYDYIHLQVECKRDESRPDWLVINIANTGGDVFMGQGSEFYQIGRDGEIISAIEKNLNVLDSRYGYQRWWHGFKIEIGQKQNGYLILDTNAARVDYRFYSGSDQITVFSVILDAQ